MAEKYYSLQDNLILNNRYHSLIYSSLLTQYSDKFENILMKVDAMKQVTTQPGASQVLFLNTKQKMTKSVGKSPQNEILTNNYISDGGLKQINMKYYNSTTFNKSNYAPTKKSSSTITPNHNANQMQLTTYNVSVRDNSELSVSNISKDELNPNNSNFTKILVSNSSKDKKEIRLKGESNSEINIKNGDSSYISKQAKEKKRKSTQNLSGKQPNIKIRAVSTEAKKKLNSVNKKEESKCEDSTSKNDLRHEDVTDELNKNERENIGSGYTNDNRPKAGQKIIKNKNKENELKVKNGKDKPDVNKGKNNLNLLREKRQSKISSESSRETEKEDRPQKFSTKNYSKQPPIEDNLNSEDIDDSKSKTNIEPNKSKSKTQHVEQRNYNTFNHVAHKKETKSKNSFNTNQFSKERIKLLSIEEKIELMGQLVRNKEEEIIKQVQKEVIEKSKQTNEKIQRKLRYLNDRNMLDNINLEEIELGIDQKDVELNENTDDINEEMNEDFNEGNEENNIEKDEDEDQNVNEIESTRSKPNYIDDLSSMNKQKRSKSSPHVALPVVNKKISKPRINTKEYIKQINNERRIYFENEENNSRINPETEIVVLEDYSNAEEVNHDKSENIKISVNQTNNENNSFRKSSFQDQYDKSKAKTAQRSASASPSINSKILEQQNDNFDENYRFLQQSNIPNYKRSNAEVQEFIKRKRREDKQKAIKLRNEEDEKCLKKFVQLTKIAETQDKIFKRQNYSHSQNPNSANTTKTKNSEYSRYQEDVKKSHSSNKIKNEMYIGKKKKNPNDSSVIDPDEYYLMLLESKNILDPREGIQTSRKHSDIKEKNDIDQEEHSFKHEHSYQKVHNENKQSQSMNSEKSFKIKQYAKENSIQILQQSGHKSISLNNQNEFDNSYQSDVKSMHNKQPSKNNEELNRIIDEKQKPMSNSNDILSVKSERIEKFDPSSYRQCDTAFFNSSGKINEKLDEIKAKVSEFKQRAINLRENNNIKLDTSKSLRKYSIESDQELSNRKEGSIVEEISHRKDKMQNLVESIVNAKDLRFSDDAFNYDEEEAYSRVKSDYNNYNEEDAYNKMLSVSESNLPFKSGDKRDRIDSEVEMNLKSCDMNAINSNTSYLQQEEHNNSQISQKSKVSINQDDIYPVIIDRGMLNTFTRQITSVFQRQFLSRFFSYIGMINKLDHYCEAFNYLETISDGFIAKNAYISFQMINQHAIMKNYYEVFNLFSIAAKRDAFRKLREYSEVVKLYEEEEMQVYETYLNSLCLFAKRNTFSKLKEFAFEEVENGYEEDVDNLIEVYTISFNKLFLPWKRNLFFELLNNMYHLAMTPRHLVKDNPTTNEEDNITVHINREQSPSNSELWYNNDADEEEIEIQETNLRIKDKSIQSNYKESLTDDILIESIGNITNKSQNFNQSIEADVKSINRSKMQMFDKNAASINKTLSMNESKESSTEKISGRFKNRKNNTFVHESFTERSLLMEYNSFDSPKLHRIHMLVEQQKRATQGASQDESNILNNISNNISESNANYINNKSAFYQDQNNDYSNDNSNIQSSSNINDNKSHDQAALKNLNFNSKQNQSKNYSVNSNRSLDMHKSNELNIENKINSQVKSKNNSVDKSGRSAVNNSYYSQDKEIGNKSTSTLNKFNNVCNSQSNRDDVSQDEISQNISERINDSRNISHVSNRLNRIDSEEDISVDKNGCSDIDWIHTVSISKSSGSFHDANINNSIRNSLNLASYVDNQINKSVENSSINNDKAVPLTEKSKPFEIIITDSAPPIQEKEKIVDEEIEEVTDEEYEKFEDNIEIEIDEANDKDLFRILDDDENAQIRDLHEDNHKNMNDNSNQNMQENLNANSQNNSNNFNKSRNISDNKISDADHIDKKICDNLSKDVSLDNTSYNELEKFDQISYTSLKDNLSKSLSQLTNKDNDIEDEAIIDRQNQYLSNETEDKITLDENNFNDKITIETAKDEESERKITKQEFISIKQENNMLTIESNDGDREFNNLKPSTSNGMKCYNLLEDKSSKNNHSSIIQLTDSDFNTLENKENHFKEHQTLSANKRYEEMNEIDDLNKLDSLPFNIDSDVNNEAIIASTCDALLIKLYSIDSFDMSSFADLIADSIIKDIFFSEITEESKALTPKKLFLREKDFLSTKKDDSYSLNPSNLNNDSLSVYSTTSNNSNSSMFSKTIIEHKKEASVNLYQDKIANSLINLITDSIQSNYKAILNNLSQPLINKPADIIQAITYRDYKTLRKSHKVLPDTIKDFTFLNKKEILPNFESTNKKIREEDNITSDNYYDNILNECVVDAANELLKKERKYGDLGEPLPWSTRTHLVRYKYNESSANVVRKHIADELTGAIQFKMGLITENNENMEFDMLNAERERRLLSSIVKELDDTEEQWKNFEIEETQIKFELSDMIFEQLLNEIIEIFEHVQLSRRKPKLYQNKSIYACEDIPRLSFQQHNTEQDFDSINQ